MERSHGFMSSSMSLAREDEDVVECLRQWLGGDGQSGRAAHDAHISKSRYGAPEFVMQLEQVVADEFEGVLAGPPADSFAVAGEVELFDLGVLGVGEGDVDETDWLVGVGAGSSGARAGDA